MKTKEEVIDSFMGRNYFPTYLDKNRTKSELEGIWLNGYQQGFRDGGQDVEVAKNLCYNDGFNKGKEIAYQELSGRTPREGKDMINESYQNGYKNGYKKGYEDGLSDAWEAARKINGTEKGSLLLIELHDIFGTEDFDEITHNLSVQEVIQALKEYEKKKAEEEIRVGDEVESCLGKWVVLNDYKSNLFGFDSEGIEHYAEKKEVKKTGRHFDQVEQLLKAMGE